MASSDFPVSLIVSGGDFDEADFAMTGCDQLEESLVETANKIGAVKNTPNSALQRTTSNIPNQNAQPPQGAQRLPALEAPPGNGLTASGARPTLNQQPAPIQSAQQRPQAPAQAFGQPNGSTSRPMQQQQQRPTSIQSAQQRNQGPSAQPSHTSPARQNQTVPPQQAHASRPGVSLPPQTSAATTAQRHPSLTSHINNPYVQTFPQPTTPQQAPAPRPNAQIPPQATTMTVQGQSNSADTSDISSTQNVQQLQGTLDPPIPPNVPTGFVAGRVAEKIQAASIAPSDNVAFNPKAESPSIPKTAGFDHSKSKPVRAGQDVPNRGQAPPNGQQAQPRQLPNANFALNQSGPISRPNLVNPHLDNTRRIGMPNNGNSPLRNSSNYKAPTLKRPAEGAANGFTGPVGPSAQG